MKCKICNTELDAGVAVCPVCGGAVEPEQETVPAEEVLIADQDAPAAEALSVEQEPVSEVTAQQVKPQKSKIKIWQLILGIAASLIVLAALAIILLTAFGVDLRPKANDIHNKDSYSVSDEKAVRAADKVVAEVNGKKLTNAMLQLYYKLEVANYLNSNADYISYLGLDVSKPLSEQTYYDDATMTWEQYFIEAAVESWRNYQSVYMIAMEEGFEPSKELLDSLEILPEDLQKMAQEEGLESADALIQDRFGVSCGVEEYMDYCRTYYISAEYIDITPTSQEIEDFYTANEAMFTEYGIDKSSGPMVNVRHILVCPQGGTFNEETEQTTYTDEELADCYARAEAILNEWKAGDATEESFAELANSKSEDGGSNTTGGLYTGITKDSSYVENFLNWCVDEVRTVGDTGIVQTEFGYHIMYFAYTQPQWEYYANTYFLSDHTSKIIEKGRGKWDMDVTYKNIVVADMDLA